MIIAVDTETEGLDARKFVRGCIVKDNYKKSEIFKDKKSMWKRIIELGESEAKRKKTLNIYAHNHIFDLHAYGNLLDHNLKWINDSPFICSYEINNKEWIKFLDNWNLFRMSLYKEGLILNNQKGKTPTELLQGKKKEEIDPFTMKMIENYMIKDAKIVLEGIKKIKELLKKENIEVRRLYTINQIAKDRLFQIICKYPKYQTEHIIEDYKSRKTYRTKNPEKIHLAYRNGRVECFNGVGNFKNVFEIDMNSLYPTAWKDFKCPDLRTERIIWKPLEITKKEELFSKIGVSKVMMINKNNDLGLLLLRTGNGNYTPRKETALIGVWTHNEIELALKEGYELINCEWSIIWDEGFNCFNKYVKDTYKLRIESDNSFNKYFYKQMMNCALGKLAQTREGSSFIIDSVSEARKYLEKNYKIIKGIGTDYMYKLENKEKIYNKKKYYAPIIPTLVNGLARCIMYKNYKKIPYKNLVYSDNDSIWFIENYTNKFNIGKELGQFKIKNKNENVIIYGRKTVSIGKDIRVSGIHKKDLNITNFKKGKVKSTQMITLKSTNEIDKAGSFNIKERDFIKQKRNYKEKYGILDSMKLYIDDEIDDVSFFEKDILKIGETTDWFIEK